MNVWTAVQGSTLSRFMGFFPWLLLMTAQRTRTGVKAGVKERLSSSWCDHVATCTWLHQSCRTYLPDCSQWLHTHPSKCHNTPSWSLQTLPNALRLSAQTFCLRTDWTNIIHIQIVARCPLTGSGLTLQQKRLCLEFKFASVLTSCWILLSNVSSPENASSPSWNEGKTWDCEFQVGVFFVLTAGFFTQSNYEFWFFSASLLLVVFDHLLWRAHATTQVTIK